MTASIPPLEPENVQDARKAPHAPRRSGSNVEQAPKASLGPRRSVAIVEDVPKSSLGPRRSIANVENARKASIGSRRSVAIADDVKVSPEVMKFMEELAKERSRSVAGGFDRTNTIGKRGPPKESAFEKLMEARPPAAIASVDTDPPGGSSKKPFSDQCSPRTRLLAAVCVALGTLAAAAFLAYSMTEFRRGRHVDTEHLVADVLHGCLSAQCRQALSFINRSLDTSVDPCHDVYAMACGRWNQANDLGVPLSYKQQLFRNYITRAHRQLAAMSSAGFATMPDMEVPSRIYTSCIAFFHDPSTRITDLWTATGMNVTRWLAVRDFPDLFSLMVHAVVASRFDSSFAIRHRLEDNYSAFLTVRTGRSLNTAVVAGGVREELIRESERALLALQGGKEEVKAEDIIQLDNSVEGLTKAFAAAETEKLMDSAQLDDSGLGVKWAPVLESAVDAAQLTWKPLLVRPVKQVFVNDPTGVRSLLTVLGRAKLKTAVHYALLVPVAEYMSLEYNASIERSRVSFSAPRWTCYGVLQELLGVQFFSALGSRLQARNTIKFAGDMWASVRRQMAAMRTVASGVELDEGTLLGMNMVAEGANGSSWNSPYTAFKDLYGGDFILNLAVHARITDRYVPAREMLEAVPHKSGAIPTTYLLPDFFYAGATESSINYGTLGAHMGKLLFDASLPRGRLAKHKPCFVDYVRENFQLDANGSALVKLLRARWGIEAAMAAWKEQRGGPVKFPPLQQLLFLRAAVTYCGEPEYRRKPLQFATRTSAAYARAFGCRDPPPLPSC